MSLFVETEIRGNLRTTDEIMVSISAMRILCRIRIRLIYSRITRSINRIFIYDIKLKIERLFAPVARETHQVIKNIASSVPVSHYCNRVVKVIDPAGRDLCHIFLCLEVCPWCGVITLGILPLAKRCHMPGNSVV